MKPEKKRKEKKQHDNRDVNIRWIGCIACVFSLRYDDVCIFWQLYIALLHYILHFIQSNGCHAWFLNELSAGFELVGSNTLPVSLVARRDVAPISPIG